MKITLQPKEVDLLNELYKKQYKKLSLQDFPVKELYDKKLIKICSSCPTETKTKINCFKFTLTESALIAIRKNKLKNDCIVIKETKSNNKKQTDFNIINNGKIENSILANKSRMKFYQKEGFWPGVLSGIIVGLAVWGIQELIKYLIGVL